MNRQYSKNLVEHIPSWHTGFVKAAFSKMRDFHFESGGGGLHCIAVGMHWFSTDFPTLQALNQTTDRDHWKSQWGYAINSMNRRKEQWGDIAKEAPKLLDFLKTIHN